MMLRISTNRMHGAERAFTLVEVLIATVVLGLGVLGLSALFAGAAKQQQSAAELSRAVIFAQNAEAFLAPRLGDLSKTSGGPSLTAGVWDALMIDDQDHLLRSNFAISGATGMYFQTQGIKTTYLSEQLTLSAQIYTKGMSVTTKSGSSLRLFEPELPHGRIIPDDRLVVIANWGPPTSGPSSPPSSGPGAGLTVFKPDTVNDMALANYLNDPTSFPAPAQVYLYPNGVNPSDNYPPLAATDTDYVLVNTELTTGRRASIERLNISSTYNPGPPADVLHGFEVSGYYFLNDQVVSINDRLLYEDDETFPDDRRPTTGYSILYRVRPDGVGAEAAVITYAMRPLTVPDIDDDELQFIPPETRQAYATNSAILREVQATLRFEPSINSYVIAPTNPANAWITEPGQILLMSSTLGVKLAPTSATPDYGADAAVRVVSQRRINGNLVGVLNDSPRVLRNTPVDLSVSPAQKNIFVWAVQPIVRSLGRDETEWRLTPIDVRTFNFSLQ